MLIIVSPGRVVPSWTRPSGSGTTRPIAVVAAGSLGVVVLGHAIGECAALPGGVVGVFLQWALAV